MSGRRFCFHLATENTFLPGAVRSFLILNTEYLATSKKAAISESGWLAGEATRTACFHGESVEKKERRHFVKVGYQWLLKDVFSNKRRSQYV